MQSSGRKTFTCQSTLTRPADTNAYASGDLIASSTTAGSIVVPSFNFSTLLDPQDEFLEITSGQLYTSLASGFTTFQGQMDFFQGTAPTFTNGDNGAYAVATGMAGLVFRMITEVSAAKKCGGDGASLDCTLGSTYGLGTFGVQPIIISRNQLLYWSLWEVDATGFTPASGTTFTLTLQGFRY